MFKPGARCKIQKNKNFVHELFKLNKKDLRCLFTSGELNEKEIETLSEISLNIIEGTIELQPKEIKKLKLYKRIIYKLCQEL
jgi:hypothetical protein